MMDILLIIIGILVLLLVALLLLRLRLHLELSEERKTVFVGLGRSGPFIDLASGQGKIRLFGIGVRSFHVRDGGEEDDSKQPPIDVEKKAEERARADVDKAGPHESKKRKRPGWYRQFRRIPWKSTWHLVSHSTRASGRYAMRLFRGTRLEELDARIRGGFDSPDETGRAYGYFQAVAAAVPQVGRHVQYDPDFTGQSLSGSFRIGLALPLYRFVGSSLLFLWDLPLREVIRLAIGKKKGADDVK